MEKNNLFFCSTLSKKKGIIISLRSLNATLIAVVLHAKEDLEQDVGCGEIPRKADEMDLGPSRTPRRPAVGPNRITAV